MNERTKCVLGSGCALLLAGAASAATWNVSTAVTDGMTGPQQITNALTQCQSGDTILVEPGTYDFTGIYMDEDKKIHLTRNANPIKTFSLVGNTDSHWAEGGNDGILFKGDGQLGDFSKQSGNTGWRGAYPTIANVTFEGFSTKIPGGVLRFDVWGNMGTAWPIVTNCVFRNCSSSEDGGAIHGGVKAIDCLFANNRSSAAGGAICSGSAYSSTFEDNEAARGGAIGVRKTSTVGSGYSSLPVAISNCVFKANATTVEASYMNGGAVYFETIGGQVSDCVFKTNKTTTVAGKYPPLGGAIAGAESDPVTVARCTFEGNESYHAGAVSYGDITDSTFKDNQAYASGGAVYACTAARCTFDGDSSTADWLHPGTAVKSALTDCTVRGSICESAATRCVFQDVGYAKACAVFFNQNWVTNSLVVRCGASLRGIAYAYNAVSGDSEFVNCTFADNVPNAYWGLFTSANAENGNPIRAVNCIFADTLTGRNLKTGDVKLDHCAYKAADAALDGTWTNEDESSFVWAKPRFAKGGGYQLRPSSPLRGKGLLLDGMADDLDLAGKSRVRDGKVDLGCYQCWTDPLGVLFLVR